jgi:hypothetical protein
MNRQKIVSDRAGQVIQTLTRFKFQQFAWADLGGPPRGFAALIGFLATQWD